MSDAQRPDDAQERQAAPSSDLEAILGQLTVEEIRFLIARSETTTDKDAAKAAGLNPGGVRCWDIERKELVRQALLLMAQDGLVTALHLRRRNLAKAMAVKVKGLDSGDERLAQSVATEVIEWELGRATQRNENKNEHSGDVHLSWGDDDILSETTQEPGGGQAQ